MSTDPSPDTQAPRADQEVSVPVEGSSTSSSQPCLERALTSTVKHELRELFELYMDLNTYKVTISQLKTMIRAYGYSASKRQFQSLLSTCGIRHRDGALTYDKFEEFMGILITQRETAYGIMKAFELFDIDRSGFITHTGLSELSRSVGAGLSEDEIYEMIVEADLDKDGLVDIQDFASIMKLTDIEW